MQGESKCVSVHPPVSTTKWNNFRPHGQIKTKFSGSIQAFARNFLVGGLNPGTLGIRTRPQKSPFPPNLSPSRVLGQGDCVMPFGNRRAIWKNEIWFSAHGLRKWGRKAALPSGQGANHNFGVSFFNIKVTPTNYSCLWRSNFCSFLFDAPRGGPQFFLKKIGIWGSFKNIKLDSGPKTLTFAFMQLFNLSQPGGLLKIKKMWAFSRLAR